MASLTELPELIGFFSYSREDDKDSFGSLSALRSRIQGELRGQLGRTAKEFRLWQDKEAIPAGTLWEMEIKNATAQAVFFIPIITPTVVASPYCRFELEAFLAREAELGRSDLVFPILYIDVPGLEEEGRDNDPVLSLIAKRQYVDWRKLRHREVHTSDVSEAVEQFCRHIRDALRRRWVSPEEREAQEKASLLQRADGEAERQKAQAVADASVATVSSPPTHAGPAATSGAELPADPREANTAPRSSILVDDITTFFLWAGTLLFVWWLIAASTSPRAYAFLGWLLPDQWVGYTVFGCYCIVIFVHSVRHVRGMVRGSGLGRASSNANHPNYADYAAIANLPLSVFVAILLNYPLFFLYNNSWSRALVNQVFSWPIVAIPTLIFGASISAQLNASLNRIIARHVREGTLQRFLAMTSTLWAIGTAVAIVYAIFRFQTSY